ncbi:MAG: hypothetical protein M3T96_08505 [Acidobacteriota bacterium]|nr:hypothetical protein [Acidobacteriota bacterium]
MFLRFELDWIKKTAFIVFAALICLIAAFTVSSGLGAFALIVGSWIFFVRRKNINRSPS